MRCDAMRPRGASYLAVTDILRTAGGLVPLSQLFVLLGAELLAHATDDYSTRR